MNLELINIKSPKVLHIQASILLSELRGLFDPDRVGEWKTPSFHTAYWTLNDACALIVGKWIGSTSRHYQIMHDFARKDSIMHVYEYLLSVIAILRVCEFNEDIIKEYWKFEERLRSWIDQKDLEHIRH